MHSSDTNLITLESAATTVTIAPHRGAIVTSFRTAQREWLYLDQATFDDAAKNVRGGIPVLFPSPGKLAGDRWNYAGESGELTQHGFARNQAWRIDTATSAQLTLALDANEQTLERYPWRFRSSITYHVAPNRLRIELRVTNDSDSPMPIAFGLHPYFHVRDKTRAHIATDATRAFDNVSKTIVPFSGFDLTQTELDLHLLDHGSTRATLQLDEDHQVAIETSAQFTRWVVWTLAGKDFVCLEPWTAPGNALNTGEGLIVVEPGKAHELWVNVALEQK